MKTKLKLIAISQLLSAICSSAFAQGTAFTYQGQLQNNGSPASGTYAMTFSLFNTNTTGVAIAVPVTNNAVGVTNGLFTTMIDFGPGVFTGATNWLQIGVETNGGSPFTTLTPRQQLTPVPYAIYSANAGNAAAATTATSAGSVAAANVSGTLGLGQLPPAVLTNNEAGVNLSGTFTGNGSGLTNLFAWQLTGNTGTTNGNFLGTTDNQPLEIRVGGGRAGYLIPSNGSPNIVFGPAQNIISNTTAGSSILGGTGNTISTNSSYSLIGGGYENIILFGDAYSALVGGYGNSIQSSAGYSTLGGGFENSIKTSATYSFLGGGDANMILGPNLCVLVGGDGNSIQSGANDSFLGGGYDNNIDTNDTYSVLGGGQQNNIQLGGAQDFLGGGYNNTISPGTSDSVLVGGQNNTLGSTWAFLGGGSHNTVAGTTSAYAVLGGGEQNSIQGSANQSFLGGGAFNVIQGNSYYAVLGGGYQNSIQGSGYGAVLGGGYQNSISNNAEYSFLGGGQNNFVGGYWATVGGGYQNNATNTFATVPGGSNNVAGGLFSFAAGANAQAVNSGAFVWADAEGTPFSSTTSNQFNVRANGGVRLVTGGAGLTVDGQPVLTNVALAQLPAAVVTNNEPNVSLGSLTLGSSLNLPYPVAINSELGLFTYHSFLYAGDNNLYLGPYAGNGNNGSYNTGIGGFVMENVTGTLNTGVGDHALALGTSSSYNTAIGGSALYNLGYTNGAGGSNNIALGYQAGINFNGNESGNIDIGNSGVQGENNVIRIGTPGTQTQTYVAGQLISSGITITGAGSLNLGSPAYINSGSTPILYADNNGNSYFGPYAAENDPGAGSGNAGIGYEALNDNLVGSYNTAVGYQSLFSNQSGGGNVAVGYDALQADESGGANTAIGSGALSVSTGIGNIAIGDEAGDNLTSGNNNIDIGNEGSANDSGIIRIGSGQTQTYLAGTVNCGPIASSASIQCTTLTSSGPATCASITITGGSDLAEPFKISATRQNVSEGAVVVIDEANPGQLKLTDRPYDTRVAGVVSGANGIHPGIQMQQQGLLEGGRNVALTGRVYVQADTSNGAINPGDLLTTSSVPGRAMKVTDHTRAAGAILGKAMSRLSEGKGMVLVLVTLQ